MFKKYLSPTEKRALKEIRKRLFFYLISIVFFVFVMGILMIVCAVSCCSKGGSEEIRGLVAIPVCIVMLAIVSFSSIFFWEAKRFLRILEA